MSDKYYRDFISYYMRDFISNIIAKHIEHVQEDESLSQESLENIQNVLQKFQAWLYQTTKN